MFGLRTLAKRRRKRAIRGFSDNLETLIGTFKAVASQTGLPHGLLWKTVEQAAPPTFVLDRDETLLALVLAEIEFDAAEDGEMDDAPGLKMIRSATIIFRCNPNNDWTPDPKAIFNLSPVDVIRLQPSWSQLD